MKKNARTRNILPFTLVGDTSPHQSHHCGMMETMTALTLVSESKISAISGNLPCMTCSHIDRLLLPPFYGCELIAVGGEPVMHTAPALLQDSLSRLFRSDFHLDQRASELGTARHSVSTPAKLFASPVSIPLFPRLR
jgi:hypothetical protein